ncbi:hypothetical protein NQ318_014654 [Aromia moschata]|uniref:DUF5641 domain-containing protein n=1 Tax=Aromia moschata TaxID=1265417 RepID=A0AAV8ZB00_9CUCU|nr:hypothetical protein NQ318_014654 [Aromia moschata]
MAIPHPDVRHVPENRLVRFQRIQQLIQHLWERWSKEFIGEMQQRCKWKQTQGELKADSLVIIKEDNQPPMSWRLGRIVELHPGKDNVNRVATVKTLRVLQKPLYDEVKERLAPRLLTDDTFTRACKGIIGAMQTTSTAAMEAMMCLPPLYIELESEFLTARYRLETGYGVTITRRGFHTEIFKELKQNRMLNMRSNRIGRVIVFHKPYRVIISNEGEEDKIHMPVQPNGTIWYTDGSKTEQSTGAGTTNRDSECEISINMRNSATIFQAEITAISACAQEM